MNFKKSLNSDSAIGLTLLFATLLALISANMFDLFYTGFLNLKLAIILGKLELSKPLYLWINDGLMTLFFFAVGLELKREFMSGHLSSFNAVMLPAVGAIGGILVPVIIFYFFNFDNNLYLQGWAIPAATDIAFAVAVLSFCSNKVPGWAKFFLLTLAIFDDLAAIIIIAAFYTSAISHTALFASLLIIIALLLARIFKINNISIYLFMGIILWFCVLKSGVHATLSGVITAILLPYGEKSKQLEINLKPWIIFLVLPLFAFANTGIKFEQLIEHGITNPVSFGSGLGLFLGKQSGVFLFSVLGISIFKYRKPKDFNYRILYGLSLLCGIGFTMSIFIASLAYGLENHDLVLQSRSGVILGSLVSATLGYLLLKYEFKK